MSEEGNGAGAGTAAGVDGGAGANGAGATGAPGSQGAVTLPEWAAGFETEVQVDPILSDFAKDATKLPEVIKGYVNAQKLIGKKGLLVPGKDAKPEEIEEFQVALGRPKEPAGYEFGKPADWPDDLPYEQGIEDWFRQTAFKAGIPAAMAQTLFKEYAAFSLDQVRAYREQAQEATEAGVKALKKEWGPDFDANFKAAGGVLVKYGGEELAGRHDLQNDPQLLKFLLKVAQLTGEDRLVQGQPGAGQQTVDDLITEVEGKMKQLVKDGKGGDGNPEYTTLRQRRDRLYEQRDRANAKK